MPSSTSSSSARRRLGRGLLAFALAFAGLWGGGELAARGTKTFAYARPFPPREELPPGDWYVDYGPDANSNGHVLLYHGIGPSLAHLRAADLVFVGNSRVLLAFPPSVVAPFEERHGLTTFNLGFPHLEACRFTRRVLEKHALHPALVVANADEFFTDFVSGLGRSILQDTRWGEAKGAFEARCLRAYRARVQPLFPRFVPWIPIPFEWGHGGAWVYYRSSTNGSWYAWNWPDKRLVVRPDAGSDELTPRQVELATDFRDLVRSWGGELVLTWIPSQIPFGSRARAQALAERLGVELIAPELFPLATSDGSHLDEESAELFAAAFLEALEELPAFRERFPPPPDR